MRHAHLREAEFAGDARRGLLGRAYTVTRLKGASLASIHVQRSRAGQLASMEHSRPAHPFPPREVPAMPVYEFWCDMHGPFEALRMIGTALVMKVGGKMFALISQSAIPLVVSLKCDPIDGQYLRDTYAAISPGYHLDKRHWISVTLDGSIPAGELLALFDQSYRLVVKGLSRAARQGLH